MNGAFIQARMGSSRLPGKVLADISGKPMVQRVLERVRAADRVERVILLTTQEASDDPVAHLGKRLGFLVYRGSTADVLDRYHQAACQFKADPIVRVTADCPLVDPALIDQALGLYQKGGYDFVSTAYPTASFPDGMDVEVFSREALAKAWGEASLASEREHVTPYLWKNPQLFRIKNIRHSPDLSSYRWTVDEKPDLAFVREIYRHFEKRSNRFGMDEILHWVKQHPELQRLNDGIPRNEGYEKSLQQDRLKNRSII